MHCDYYVAGVCRSCTLIELPHPTQVHRKTVDCHEQLATVLSPAALDGISWLDPVVGPERGFRTKAKMVVGGTTASPTLGILGSTGTGVDLEQCGLYPPELSVAFAPVKEFISRARLIPYDVPGRSGELKTVVFTAAPSGELMIRFVMRSTEALARMRKHLPVLMARLPQLTVASINVLAEHRAVLEGEREILLTDRESLTMTVNGIDLRLRPQSFFQTNTDVAAALYGQVREWVADAAPTSVWDLYCGVGGFSLHVLAEGRDVVGVELSEQAIDSARATASSLVARGVPGAEGASFVAADATQWAASQLAPPELVIVNPPRRGIGDELAIWLEKSGVPTVIYSSCNSRSLARDLAAMPSLVPVEARVLDMFPHTEHYEVAVLLKRA